MMHHVMLCVQIMFGIVLYIQPAFCVLNW